MSVNVGTLDRSLRALVGVVLLALAFGTSLTAGSALLFWGAVIVGIVMLATAVFRLCPLYSLLGLKTCRDC
ncbi:YgaP family membrane protein [Anianabacter salinae]|uniref:YgaP family membrane protein n=1 Tax=Anianabacter salinae TaxID=2851023 RepID=UPI00225E3EE2|nr:DUF2892 domain-containing protein [Anianabacter salinae]MBV0912010.1 DUF2892 domain-containing protein [Anianabacter salinae]